MSIHDNTQNADMALIFPGQGSQTPGMGQEIIAAHSEARDTLQEVDDALGEPLSALIANGPEEELRRTANAQPALMAVSIAIFRVLAARGLPHAAIRFVAGHSLGEYSALTAAGVFSAGDAARLLRLRGEAMQRAAPEGQGAMAAFLGMEAREAEAIANSVSGGGKVCALANDNAPGQAVVSGHKEAVEQACQLALKQGAKRAQMLAVSAPFHCPLMQPAAEAMQDALAKAKMNRPSVPLVANITAAPVEDPEEIRRLLVAQVTGRVRWRESVAFMAGAGVKMFAEIGAGRVLTGLVKRIARDAETMPVNDPASVEKLLALKQ